jgi:hypothetical protein
MMSLRERIRTGLLGGVPDRVPLHCRARMLPLGAEGDWARHLGWGILSSHSGLRVRLDGCQERWEDTEHQGRACERQVIATAAGELSSLSMSYRSGRFTLERFFKGPGDYAPLLAMIQAMRYEPDYAGFDKARAELGDAGYLYSYMGYDPLHEIVIRWMGVETFSYEWADRRSMVLQLYDALAAKHREMYAIVAAGPAEFVAYGANIQPNIVGRARFAEYYLPCYQEFGALLHARGKRLGAHMDDKTRDLADLIALCPWDVMEAFAVPPDGDVSVAQARVLWPGRVISLNFPSGLQHSSTGEIKAATRRFVREAGPAQGILISLTEDYPPELERDLFTNIAQAATDMPFE